MIQLTDFMPVDEPHLTKLKFNIREGTGGEYAWDFLLRDDPTMWLHMNRWRNSRPSNNMGSAQYLLAFAQYYPYGPEYYIFGGYFRVAATDPVVLDGVGYNLEPLEQYSEYSKRLIVKLKKPIGRDVYLRKYSTVQNSSLAPEVYELAPDTKLGAFPGYQRLCVRHADLQRIIANSEPSWKDALSSVKGVYVITDLSTGQLYVGSASGEANGLWQRWSTYADVKNLTGGNRGFEQIKQDLTGKHIIENFQYSILEIFDPKTKSDVILRREAFWKRALDTRAHGMNRN